MALCQKSGFDPYPLTLAECERVLKQETKLEAMVKALLEGLSGKRE